MWFCAIICRNIKFSSIVRVFVHMVYFFFHVLCCSKDFIEAFPKFNYASQWMNDLNQHKSNQNYHDEHCTLAKIVYRAATRNKYNIKENLYNLGTNYIAVACGQQFGQADVPKVPENEAYYKPMTKAALVNTLYFFFLCWRIIMCLNLIMCVCVSVSECVCVCVCVCERRV